MAIIRHLLDTNTALQSSSVSPGVYLKQICCSLLFKATKVTHFNRMYPSMLLKKLVLHTASQDLALWHDCSKVNTLLNQVDTAV